MEEHGPSSGRERDAQGDGQPRGKAEEGWEEGWVGNVSLIQAPGQEPSPCRTRGGAGSLAAPRWRAGLPRLIPRHKETSPSPLFSLLWMMPQMKKGGNKILTCPYLQKQ